MGNVLGAKWSQWVAIEVTEAKDLVTGRELGVDAGSLKTVECQHSLWDEVAPSLWWPVSVCAIEDGDEVGFECLHCSFCWIPSMHVGVDKLVVKILGSNAGCEFIRNFIVKSVEDWFDSCIHEALAACIMPFHWVFCSSALDWFS